jgi:hypothetical protein
LAPGKVSRPDYEYKRCGTANLFCAVEPLTGKHFTLATPNRKAPQFAEALETIIGSYPEAATIHLVMDNLNIHVAKSLTDHFGEEKGTQLWDRLTVHYIPNTAAGLIRLRLKSVFWPANASVAGGFQTWKISGEVARASRALRASPASLSTEASGSSRRSM